MGFLAGLITIGPVPKYVLEKIKEISAPALLVNYPDELPDFDMCRPDGYNGGKIAARTLFERGHRVIDYYHFDSPDADDDLLNGFYETLVQYSDLVTTEVHTTTPEDICELFEKRLNSENAPTAAFFYWEEPAAKVQHLLHRLGISPGKEFSLIFSGEFIEDEIRPRRHACVVYDCDHIAYKAVEMLLARMEGKDKKREVFKAEYDFFEGETCKTVPGQPVRPEYANLPDPDPEWENNERQFVLSKARGTAGAFPEQYFFS